MSAREGLAEVVSTALGDVVGIWDTSHREDLEIADAIMAAGYVEINEAAIDRAAGVLAMKSYTLDMGIAFDDYKRVARAVIAALREEV